MPTIIRVALLLLMVVLASAGCSDETTSTSAPAGSSSRQAASSAAPAVAQRYPADQAINDFLLDVAKRHSLAAHIDGDWVVFDATSVRVNGKIVDENPHDGKMTILQANMRVLLPQRSTPIVQPVVGFGKDHAAALAHAEGSYLAGTYHAILGAFVLPGDKHVETEHRVIGGRERIVTFGDIVTKVLADDPKPDNARWHDQLLAALDASSMSPGLHWVDVYHGYVGEHEEMEIQFDNGRWTEMEQTLRTAPWPKVGKLTSVRQFLVIQDLNDPTRPPTTAPVSQPTTTPSPR